MGGAAPWHGLGGQAARHGLGGTGMSHALIRTSPKGKGHEFIGTCTKCGTPNLPFVAASQSCPLDEVVSDAAALVHTIKTPHREARE